MASGERIEILGAEGVVLVGERWVGAPEADARGHVVLLHGGGQTRHSWAATGERLARLGWTALAVDARGHGESGRAADSSGYALEPLVEDLKAVIDWVGEPPVVLGASMGGITALVAEGESSGLLRGLVLVDVTPTLDAEGVAKIAAFMRSGLGGFATLEDAADAIVAYNPHRPRPKNLDGLKKNLRLREDGRWYWHWDPAFMERDPQEPTRGITEERRRRAASQVRIPTLLVRGEQSDIVTPEGAQELLALIPGARLVEAPQAGHMVAGDDNDLFTAAVETFLDELPVLSR
jgi:pimeloyl-ACP methyl ester carboxylesterase